METFSLIAAKRLGAKVIAMIPDVIGSRRSSAANSFFEVQGGPQ